MCIYSQELPNSPEMKGTYLSSLPSTFWDWVIHSGYRPGAEKLSVQYQRIIECSELQDLKDHLVLGLRQRHFLLDKAAQSSIQSALKHLQG